jgi:DNA-binding SARP family transcriptional activator
MKFNTFLAFLVGVIIGIIANIFLQDVELSQFGAFAAQAYLNESPEVGIWDLTNHIKEVHRVLKERDNPNFYFIVPLQQYLMEDHIRLALLYEKTGDNLKRQESIKKALEYYRSTHPDSEITEERLIEFVLKCDEESGPLE